MQGYINSFETMGLVDGPGVRFVVFMQGCPLRCMYCHNPETWTNGAEIEITPDELVEKIKRYLPYFGENGGVTFSGGEALRQPEFLLECLKLLKESNIHTCLDTSGVGQNYEEILDYTDLVILDVKDINPERYKKLTGLDIEQFNKFLDVCQQKNKKMWLRQVIVPDYNDKLEDIDELARFIAPLKNIEKVELLPYHTMAESKYEKLGIPYRLKGKLAMDKTKCKELETYLRSKLSK